ncbi:hypothetical protein GAH_01744 [Geoglobus ahangari]|uniref:Uncharacterized protein n=1 Tax=Geoglobus ahangari TaxID=113653 RepID=A0A0F7ICH7_9EURY|nr:hypothetical protein [Geoglobus ahangari]AKG90977.1 hypothetical protein GAH_01744 [Geoglobus ahangari]
MKPIVDQIQKLQGNLNSIQLTTDVKPILTSPVMVRLLAIEAKIDELKIDIEELKEVKQIEKEEYEKLKRKLKELEEELNNTYQ